MPRWCSAITLLILASSSRHLWHSLFSRCMACIRSHYLPCLQQARLVVFRDATSSNHAMERTSVNEETRQAAPLRNKSSFFATTPSTSSRFPASLVRLKLVRCPHSLAPTLVALPSMSLAPPLHSLGSRTLAVLFFNDSHGLSLSR